MVIFVNRKFLSIENYPHCRGSKLVSVECFDGKSFCEHLHYLQMQLSIRHSSPPSPSNEINLFIKSVNLHRNNRNQYIPHTNDQIISLLYFPILTFCSPSIDFSIIIIFITSIIIINMICVIIIIIIINIFLLKL